MRLRAERPMAVTVRDLGLSVEFAAGEEMRTEISAKFRREGLAAELAAAGFAPRGRGWTRGSGSRWCSPKRRRPGCSRSPGGAAAARARSASARMASAERDGR